MKVLREVLRRVRNFLRGPHLAVSLTRRDYCYATVGKPHRLLYLIPHPTILRWYENPHLHFQQVGIIEVDWLVWTVGLYWRDNN